MSTTIAMHLAPDHASVRGYADDAVKNFRKIENIELDYSLDSLKQIDDLLLDWKQRGAPLSQINKSLFAMGSYAGETLLKIKGGSWQAASTQRDDDDAQRRFLYLRLNDGTEWFPIYQVFALMMAPAEQAQPHTLGASLAAVLSAAPQTIENEEYQHKPQRKIFSLDTISQILSGTLSGLKQSGSPLCQTGSGFAAGTLVHTQTGLVPIEQIKVGDWVLSKPEDDGEQAYKRVLMTFQFEPQRVMEVYVAFPEDDNKAKTVIATPNHPFWVHGEGWTAAKDLPNWLSDQQFELCDGRLTSIRGQNSIYVSEQEGVGWTSTTVYDLDGVGRLLEYPNRKLVTTDVKPLKAIKNGKLKDSYFKLPVYNLEVEDSHTYYVGEFGTRVRSAA